MTYVYRIPPHLADTDTNSLLTVQLTKSSCVVSLVNDGAIIDRFLYALTKGGKVRVPGAYEQSPIGAALHAATYWYVAPRRTNRPG